MVGFNIKMKKRKKAQKQLQEYLELLNNILVEAENEIQKSENGVSIWREKELKQIVIPEMEELKAYAIKGEMHYKYGICQRMLESTYLIPDSMDGLDNTHLGIMIIKLQQLFNKIKPF